VPGPAFLRGQFTPRGIRRYVGASFGAFALQIGLAIALFPPEEQYHIMTDAISYLGDFTRTPTWWLFSTAMITAAVTNVPLLLHIYRGMRERVPRDAAIGLACLLIGSLGAVGVAFFPDVYSITAFVVRHHRAAFFMFGGYLAGINGFAGLFHRDVYHLGRNLRPLANRVPFGSYIGYLITWALLLTTHFMAVAQGLPWPRPGIYSFSLWEWILLIFTCLFVYSLALAVPAAKRSTEDSKC
jgi:hypothetical membrane protein